MKMRITLLTKDNIMLCACLCAISAFGGMWLGSNATLAKPLDRVSVEETGFAAPTPIEGGDEDVSRFLSTHQCYTKFKLVNAVKDESLGRRYYHVKIAPADVATMRGELANGWKWGKISRAVYHNDINSRLPRSRNLPGWWRKFDTDEAEHLMLDHGGIAKWYVIFAETGDACLMWTGK